MICDDNAEDRVRSLADPLHRCHSMVWCPVCVANLAVQALNAKNEQMNQWCKETQDQLQKLRHSVTDLGLTLGVSA